MPAQPKVERVVPNALARFGDWISALGATRSTWRGVGMAVGLAAGQLAGAQPVSPAPPPPRVFNLLAYGGAGDRKTPNTDAFRRAIAACHQAGGGIVEVPAGHFLTGPIEMVDNMTLQVDAGAVVVFTTNRGAYPPVPSRWEGLTETGPHPLLWANGLHHIAIVGPGAFDGQGSVWWPDRVNRRPPLVQIKDCDDVRIEGAVFANSPFWTVHLLYSDNIDMGGCTMLNPAISHNTDGVDVDSCRHVVVHDCAASVGDDGFCIKSGQGADGRAVNRPSEDITFLRDHVASGHCVCGIGSETSGGVRHVRFLDCDGNGTEAGIRIKSDRGRGGVVEDVVASNLRLKNVGNGVLVTLNYSRTSAEAFSVRTPVFRNFSFDHIVGAGLDSCVTIEGLRESPIQGLSFNAMALAGRSGISCSYAKDVTFTDVKISAPFGKFSVDHSVNVRRVDPPAAAP